MKGVIVQMGKPKSIVLFNNGKIGAIETPPDCHVGMVVTVKYNNKLKILLVILASVLLAATGILTGVSLAEGKMDTLPPAPLIENDETSYGWQRGQEKMREIEKKFP
jgi:hypothetical protein